MWNPFKKKQQIYNGYFGQFGNSSYSWSQIYTDNQNNSLLTNYFNSIAEVAAPIMKYADGAAQIKLTTKNKEIEKLLKNPNFYQGFGDWFSLLMLNKRLYGNAIVNAFTAEKLGQGKKPTALFILNPKFIGIKTNSENDFRFNEINKYIFDLNEVNKSVLEIDPENILHLKNANPNFKANQYLFGISRYTGVYRNIESIIEGYNAKVNLYKSGPRLIITGKSQGEFASMNNSENIEIVQKAMRKYGYGDGKYPNLITDVPLDVKNVSLNVRELQIKEINQSDFQRICDAQSIDSKVFSDSTGATFSNKAAALADFYNNSFRSEVDSIVEDLNNFLAKWFGDSDLKPDYSNFSEIVEESQKEKIRLFEDVKSGILTRNEYLTQIGKEIRNEATFNELYFYTTNGWVSINNEQNGTKTN